MRKLKHTGGFTLIEMLIVVAIIAILIAVSIPTVNTSLEKSREATDAANERAAKAAATIAFLTGDLPGAADPTQVYRVGYFDAVTGTLVTDHTGLSYGKCKEHKGDFLCVMIWVNPNATYSAGTVTVQWWDVNGSDYSNVLDSESLVAS
jgi:prepilin-type N-terminal cleavage/methylation domain-containing protein